MRIKKNRHVVRNISSFILVPLIFVCACSRDVSSSETVKSSEKWAKQVAVETVAKIRKSHPRIYLTEEMIPELRKQALSTKVKSFELMKKRTGGKQAALFYALGANNLLKLAKSREEYGRMAADFLMQAIAGNEKKTSPDELAIVYDWAHGALTDKEKRTYVDFCKSRFGKKLRVHNEKAHGYRTSPRPEGIIAALSFYDDGIDDAYAKELLIQGIRDTLLDNLAIEHSSGTDGGFADGTYYIFQLGGTFDSFLALSTATGSSFLLEHDALARLPNQLVQALLPFRIERATSGKVARYFSLFHDNWTSTTAEYGSIGLILAKNIAVTAAEFHRKGDDKNASLYMWLVKEAFGGIPNQAENPVSFVLIDESIIPKGPKELGLPLAEALGWDEKSGELDHDRFGKKAGIGWVAMRSAWDDPDATFAIFKAEPFYYHGHMHHDSLAFMIAKGEELALARSGNYMCWYEGGPVRSKSPGWPQTENFFKRTISTNNLLVYDPSEKFDEWTNDGGQRLAPYWDDKWGRTYNGTENGNTRDIGGLIRFERENGFVYSVADATRAYNSEQVTSGGNKPKVKLVQREFVYLPPANGDEDFFVVFDRVEATKPDFKKLWLLQLRAKPEFDGTHRVTLGREDGGIHYSENTSTIHVTQERSELTSTTLLPKAGNRLVRRLGGSLPTRLKQPLGKNDNGPRDIEVESTIGMPEHPSVIITAQEPDPKREIFDAFNVWPIANHASGKAYSDRVAYFCNGKTPVGNSPAKLLDCVRATKSSPGFDIPAGARVIQEFRHMGVEGIDKGTDAERIDYPWGYGFGYGYGDGNQYGLWRIEISPKHPSRLDNFLHVLQPTLKGKGKAVASELIESPGGALYGARIGKRAIIFAKGAEQLTKGEYALAGSGKVRQLVCDLKPGRKYTIHQDGKSLFTLPASKQGVLQFDIQLTGKSTRIDFVQADK